MKGKHWIWAGMTVMIVLAACASPAAAPSTETAPPVVEEPPPTAPLDATDPPQQEQAETSPAPVTEEIDVEALIQEKLCGTHGIARVLGANKTREQWEVTIDRMIGYGAKINEEEKKIIIDWLLSR